MPMKLVFVGVVFLETRHVPLNNCSKPKLLPVFTFISSYNTVVSVKGSDFQCRVIFTRVRACVKFTFANKIDLPALTCVAKNESVETNLKCCSYIKKNA